VQKYGFITSQILTIIEIRLAEKKVCILVTLDTGEKCRKSLLDDNVTKPRFVYRFRLSFAVIRQMAVFFRKIVESLIQVFAFESMPQHGCLIQDVIKEEILWRLD